jgi:putative phosphonate catabolism associated alcohol dehydrogenase
MSGGRAAVMYAPGEPLRLMRFPVPEPAPGCLLVRVRCCTICKSDLHTWAGRRSGPTPVILGHEIVGRIAALGDGVTHDSADRPVGVGDRVTWTIADSCGKCFYCREKGLPMKCRALRKYGHDSCDEPPHFRGGFAEYCYVTPGTCVIKVPDSLDDATVAPANCALATVVAGWEAAGLAAGEHVLVQGAGGLGCYAAAVAHHAGCRSVVVTDTDDARLERVRRYGATHTINVRGLPDDEIARGVRDLTGGFGADCALEVAGAPEAIPQGLACLRKGGRYVEIGCSFPDAVFSLDASLLLWNRLQLIGVHNYDTRHLQRAVDFLEQTCDRYPFDALVSHRFPLEQINEAMALAESGTGLRVAVTP